MSEKQKFLGILNFTFMAEYSGDKTALTEKLSKKFKEEPELIVEFIKEENGFHLELVPLYE